MKARTYVPDKPCKWGHQLRYVNRNNCVACIASLSSAWRKVNDERLRTMRKAQHLANRGKSKTYLSDKPCRHGHRLRYLIRNSCAVCKRARIRALRKSKPEECRAKYRAWYRANAAQFKAMMAARNAQKLRATPPWLTSEYHRQILDFYTEADRRTRITGIAHHVDHWCPLQGENVCGLHVPWNLQIIRGIENWQKNNRFDENAPYYGMDPLFW
jgi:hypothetical protein